MIYLVVDSDNVPASLERLVERLKEKFSASPVYVRSSLKLSFEFKRESEGEDLISLSDVVLVLITRGWGERVSSLPEDENPVVRDIIHALNLKRLVIPVVFEGGCLPSQDKLPASLMSFGQFQPGQVNDLSLEQDIGQLIERIDSALALRSLVNQSKAKDVSVHQEGKKIDFQQIITDKGMKDSTLGELRYAINQQELSLAYSRKSGNVLIQIDALEQLGLAYGRLGEIVRSIDCFTEGLELLKENHGSLDKIIEMLANLGDAHAVRGDALKARPYYEEQISLALEKNDHRVESEAWVGLGHVHIKTGEIEQGISAYLRALKFLESEGRHMDCARIWIGIGLNQVKLKRLKEALTSLKKALFLVRQVGDRDEELKLLEDLGQTAEAMEDMNLASVYFEEEFEMARVNNRPETEARALVALAGIQRKKNNRLREREYLKLAYERICNLDYQFARKIKSQLSDD